MDEWLLLQNGYVVYLALFLLLLGGAIGLPIPEDLPLLLGGVLAYRGNGKLEIILLVCYLAILAGDVLIFFIGRFFGSTLFKSGWFQKRFPPARVREIRKRLERRRFVTILIARHLFYLRTVTFLTCGAVKMRFEMFIVADALAALVSAPLMIGLGYLAAEHYDALMAGVHRAKIVSIVVGIVLLLGAVIIYRRRRRLAHPSPAESPPPTDLSTDLPK